MITIKTVEEIKILRAGGKILADILHQVASHATSEVACEELNALSEKLIKQFGGEPSFKNYKTSDDRIPYPASLCVSVNNEVVHGIPDGKILREGDIVGLDLGMKYKGLYTDTAITIPIGNVSENARKIIDVAEKSLNIGIQAVKEGAYIGDIGFAIQNYVESHGFNVVRKLVGHGVGYGVHEEPEVPHYGKAGTGAQLKEGMILALEPMINDGGSDVVLDNDGWTWKTKDDLLSAHFEHTIAVTKTGAEILTKI